MKYPCIERTVEIECFGYKIRLWINAEGDYTEARKSIDKAFPPNERHTLPIKKMLTIPDMVKELAEYCTREILYLNAVQVIYRYTDFENEGYMIYTVPFEDKKDD